MVARRTKIVVSAGPATDDERVLTDLIAAGTDAVRVSLAHGTVDDARRRISAVQHAAA
ncbi:MAG: pyruvate kinase, partial [Actinobacteria bacterium]|nr:pyruvate kinase [Actinomycetota bacterium]